MKLNFKKNLAGELVAKYNEYEFKICKDNKLKLFKLDLLNEKTKIKESEELLGTLKNLKKLADEMIEYRLNDTDYFKKSVEFEIELISKNPKRFENAELELLRLKATLKKLKNVA